MIRIDIIANDTKTCSPIRLLHMLPGTRVDFNIEAILEDKGRLHNTTYEFLHAEAIIIVEWGGIKDYDKNKYKGS